MAEFSEVMKQAKRMCNAFKATACRGCPCDLGEECMLTGIPYFTSAKRYADAEKNVMKWAAENPEPRYPTWVDAWEQLFPDMAETNPPCPRYFMDEDRAQEYCGGRCAICRGKPISADIAEKLGVKPIGGRDDA